jgi:flagellum-specific peptidoglycan hydrolase FlgJ
MEQNKKLTPKEFVDVFKDYAFKVQGLTGISAIAILAQAAWESGWNKATPGWMFFGVKDTDGVNGNEQLLTTTEYHRTQDVKYPEIISITPVVVGGVKMFKYKIKDYFRKYDTPEGSFMDHANFFLKNPRYKKALEIRYDPHAFLQAVADAGYATDPEYAKGLHSIINSITKLING